MKTARPVRCELAEVTRQALDDYLLESGRKAGQLLFPGRRAADQSLTTRQYARLLSQWISGAGLDRLKYATHSHASDQGHAHLSANGEFTRGATFARTPAHRLSPVRDYVPLWITEPI